MPDEDVRAVAAAQPVVELGHDAPADGRAELAERAGPLGNGDAEERLARLADFGALGDEAQPIEVHVRAAQHRHEPRVPGARALHPRPQAGHGQRAGRLHDRARVVEDVLDRGADLVVRDADDLVDRRLHDRERELADLADRDAVGEDADAIEHDAPSGRERLVHRVRLERLDADDADARPQRLDVAGDPGDQPAAADRHEDRRDVAELVPQDLVGDRALSGDHERIVERMHEASGPVSRASSSHAALASA